MYAAGLYFLQVLRELYPAECILKDWLPHLVGTKRILADAFDAAEYLALQKPGIAAFAAERAEYLLY
jgi:hypothetical protein